MTNPRDPGGMNSANAGSGKSATPSGVDEIFCRYIVKNGVTIYPKNARFFHFFVKH